MDHGLTCGIIDIWEDVAEECGKFGRIIDMKIPKPQGGQPVAGLGKVKSACVWVDYDKMAHFLSLQNRSFCDMKQQMMP